MRFALLAVLTLTACGNWSNEDLEYLYALPQKDALKSQLGAMTGNTTQQPVSVGDPSTIYDDTKKQSDAFNAFIDSVLTALDQIRTVQPTRREATARFWGPWPDSTHPGFDVQVEIHRENDGANYSWSIKYRPRAGDFFTIAGGDFTPTTQTLRKGRGNFFLDMKTIRDRLGDMGHPTDPDRADIHYATDADPVIVQIDFTFGTSLTAGYAFNGYADQSAMLQWVVADPSNLLISKARFTAAWNPKTAGRGDYLVLEGKYASAIGTECWDEGHIVVYGTGYTDAGFYEVGDKTKCIDGGTLATLPDGG
jgi:hypothetical protein